MQRALVYLVLALLPQLSVAKASRAKKPSAQKPSTQKPSAQKPSATKPSAKKPSTQKSSASPKFYAKAYLILDNRDGRTLLAHHAEQKRAIASLTKLQAALLLRARKLDLEAGTQMTLEDHRVAAGGCRSRLHLHWTYRNIDLLHALLMSSDNRAVSALGRAVGLSAAGVVRAMNVMTKQQKLKQTKFYGPAGIDHRNVSTARELAVIAQQAAKDPVLREVMGKGAHLVKPLKGSKSNQYYNTNPQVGAQANIVFQASKTGFNSAAGYCFAAVVTIGGSREFTVILLGAGSKNQRLSDIARAVGWLEQEASRTEAAATKRAPTRRVTPRSAPATRG